MATQPRLVNKQFNSPINLYSRQNIQEVLDRETQILANGAVGIDFRNNPTIDKPGNLKNSAVLRMLEEEENRQRNGFGPGKENISKLRTWPPPDYEHTNVLRSTFKDVVTPGVKRVAWPPPNEQEHEISQEVNNNPVPTKGAPQYSISSQSPSSGLHQQQQQNFNNLPKHHHQQPLKPLDITQRAGTSPLSSPITNQSPQAFRPSTPASNRGWAPVHSPTAHQPVTQQTFLGQQYLPPNYNNNPVQSQNYSVPSQIQQQHQVSGQIYRAPSQQYSDSNVSVQHYQSPSQQYSESKVSVQHYQAPSQQYSETTKQYHVTSSAQYQVSQQYQGNTGSAVTNQIAPKVQSRPVEPPPSIITLRPQPPISQAPPPLITSQPATATLKVKVGRKHLRGDLKWPPEDVKIMMLQEAENVDNHNSFLSLEGGKHLRGDLKWPPENVKRQEEEENRLRLELAKGPVFKPKRPNKDYTGFFEQHRLNSTYPGYKIPPGTQFYRPA